MSKIQRDFEVTHIVKRSLKNIYLKVTIEEGLIIKTPKISKSYLEEIIDKKSEWIKEKLQELQKKVVFQDNTNTFIKDSKIYYLGGKFLFEIVITNSRNTKLVFDVDRKIFVISTNQAHKDNTKLFLKKLDEFYKMEANKIIPQIVDKYSTKMDLAYKSINYRKTKRRWGSCSFDNRLNFSTNLIKSSYEAIESVVIHELAHIKHKNHSKKFYDLVKIYDPKYKEFKKELSQYV